MALIELRGVHKVYEVGSEHVHALAGVDLDIERGEYVAIMGASGSGKSTLMNLLGCLDTPSEGSYALNGTAVESLSDEELAMYERAKTRCLTPDCAAYLEGGRAALGALAA